MDAILNAFFADPLQYVGLVFAFVAAIAMMFFIAGFFAGLPHFFTLSANEEHQEHHRHRITWGTMTLYTLFIVWECVKIVASWFGYPTPNVAGFEAFMLVLVIIIAALWVMFKVKDTVTSGGH